MSLTTYAGFKTFMASFVHRDDLTSLWDDFVTLAESHIYDDLKTMLNEATETVTSTSQAYALSGLTNTFKNMLSLYATVSGVRRPLQYMSKFDMDRQTSGVTDYPVYYTIQSNALEIRPVTGNQSLTLTYFYQPTSLVSAANAIFTAWPDLYVKAVAAEVAAYEENDDKELKYRAQLASRIMDLNWQAELARTSGDGVAASNRIG